MASLTSEELGTVIFQDLSSKEIVDFCRKVGKSVWYVGDNIFVTHPEELVGVMVNVPEPCEGDCWNNMFMGTVVAYKATKYLTVKDMEDNVFDVECYKIDPV